MRRKIRSIYRAGAVLRVGSPLLAALVAAGTASAIRSLWPLGGIWALVVATAGGVAIASLLVIWAQLRNRRLELFADGSFRYSEPDRTVIARWDQITMVYGIHSRPRRFLGRHEYRVLAGDLWLRLGSEIGADAALGMEIDLRTRPMVVARTEALVAAGVPVEFGPIRVTESGIEVNAFGKRTIAYQQLQSQDLGRHRYKLQSLDSSRPVAVPIARIPSPEALHEVLQARIDRGRQCDKAA